MLFFKSFIRIHCTIMRWVGGGFGEVESEVHLVGAEIVDVEDQFFG